MKVLFLAPGSSTHTEKWVNTLTAKGVEVHLVYIAGHEPIDGHISKDVHLHCLSKSGGKAYYLCGRELRKLAKEIKPDVVNAHYASGYGTLARMADIHPLVLSFWGSDIYDFPNLNRINYSIIKKNIKNADMIASTSNCMADEIRKTMSMPNLEIGITPFGIDTKLFSPKEVESREDYDELVVGTVKGLEPVYRIDLLVQAFAEAVRLAEGTELENRMRLKIYGDGSLREELENMIREFGIEDKASLEGRIANTDVPAAIEQMNLFCAFSRKESFGVAVVEAMAMGRAVLTSAADGFREVQDDGVTGMIVHSDYAINYARAIIELLEDPELRTQMGKAGMERANKLYNWDNNVDTMIDIYGKAVCKQK